MQEYSQQRNEKEIGNLKTEVEKLVDRIKVVTEEVENYKGNFNVQISNIIGNLNRIKGTNSVVYLT